MKIIKRDYSDASDRIKGVDKIGKDRIKTIKDCELTLCIITLDENEYTVNADGNPEMTEASQKEYDSFISKIREGLISDGIKIIDEGRGEGEDELDWYITAGFIRRNNDNILGIIEIQICVRTEVHDE